jgi:hypothetical protein
MKANDLKTVRLHRLLPALLTCLLLQGIVRTASADQPITKIHNIGSGSLTISAPSDPDKPEDWLIVGTTTSYSITVSSGYSGTITLKDVNITYQSAQWKNAIYIQGTAQVTLKLMGTNNITSVTNGTSDNLNAVIRVNTGAYLTIESYNGVDADGILNVTQAFGGGNGQGGAAIGSNYFEHNGHITINSGTVNARGGDDCAGIGGGSNGAGGWITINGGKVIGNCDSHQGSANSGAGIGAGYHCTTSTNTFIRINGGDVTAISLLKPTEDASGSAIGTGNGCSGFGYIIITGGTIRASVRSLFNAAGQPVHPDNQSLVLEYDDTKSGLDGLKYNSSHVTGNVTSSMLPYGYQGRSGCGIGGGANSTALGTIIILPSASVERVYGGTNYTGNLLSKSKDIGNCGQLFYLNKSPLRVGTGASDDYVTAKNFTIRTSGNDVGADMFVHIPAANTYIPAVAAKVGTTPAGGILGLTAGDALKYYTNVPSTYFTSVPNVSYGSLTEANSTANLNGAETYNPMINNPYNVIIPGGGGTYNFQISEGCSYPGTTPGSVDRTMTILYFGSAKYDRYKRVLNPGSDSIMAFRIENTGSLWLDIRVDSALSNIRYFDLEGPVVSPPSVAGGAHLPVGTSGVITATLKQQVPVGNLTDTLILIATEPNNPPLIVHRCTVYLHIDVTQQLVAGDTGAYVLARNPDPPIDVYASPVKTNSTVRLNARAVAPDIDGVKAVWYKFDADSTATVESGHPSGYVPGSDPDWTKIEATLVDGKFGYNFLLGNIQFPNPDGIYNIHWFVETVNTRGSRSGVIGRYDVRRNRPQPDITGVTSIGVAPVTLTIEFQGNALDTVPTNTPTPGMFSVSNATIVGGLTPAGQNRYTFQVQANGAGLVSISFGENYVKDEYGNWNTATASPYTLTYSNGIPQANFSTIDSVYFLPQSFVQFSISSGVPNTTLYRNDMTPIDNSNAGGGLIVTGTTPSVAFNPTGNIYTLTGSFTDGAYTIRIFEDSVRNELQSPIRDTSYTFKVYKLALDHTTLHTFPAKNEGYPAIPPETVTITNNGTQTATGLSVVLSGTNAADFTVNTNSMATSLATTGSTTFTVAPRTGLLQGTYTATVTLLSNGNPVGSFNVSFTVIKLPPPEAMIDYVNETFTNLSVDTAYVFNGSQPVAPVTGGAVAIPDSWMSGNAMTIEKVDPSYNALSAAQQLTVPRRPAAPATLTGIPGYYAEVNDGEITGVNDSMEYRLSTSDVWIPVSAGAKRLSDLPPGYYLVRYKAIPNTSFASVSAVLNVQDLNLPTIMREVQLPEAAGVTVTPRPGVYHIESYTSFTFTLTFSGAQFVVRTNRYIEGVRETLPGAANAAGGYDYIIPRVQENIVVTIGPETVSNAAVDGPGVWASGGKIHIRALKEETVDIYTITGLLFERVEIAEGVTSVPAPVGVYIVRPLNGAARKVIVH